MLEYIMQALAIMGASTFIIVMVRGALMETAQTKAEASRQERKLMRATGYFVVTTCSLIVATLIYFIR